MSDSDKNPEPRKRASAVIVKDGKVLLIHRVKPGRDYYIFPGGGVERGESVEDALAREVAEELTLKVVSSHFLFSAEDELPSYTTKHPHGQIQFYFFVDEWSGVPELGGEEMESMNEENQYRLVWVPVAEMEGMPKMASAEAAKKVAGLLSGS